ncbi:zeta-sarcoglycan-like isoform X2 [Varroa jacobsoni]|uniref:zeta-sarcoglycan-like isoform X2 n=1 Tax=Varroa jacobsoni TaxID=62625 RepID=UPI000BF5F12A|nr:zeta-sarcoglycan-like isoform X2 [Varroa jacobsoni]
MATEHRGDCQQVVPLQDGNGHVRLTKNPIIVSSSATGRVRSACISSKSTLAFHLLVALTVTVVCVNLAMNIFLIRVLQLTRTGMSSVKFSPSSGIWLRDRAVFADLLRTTRLSHVNYNREQRHEGLLMSSEKDVHIESNNRAGKVNSLSMSAGGLEVRGDAFEVFGLSPGRGVLFRAGQDEIVIAANEVPVSAPNGFILRGSLQANTVRGSPRYDLRLESPLKEVNVQSAGDVLVESKTEHINVKSVDTVNIISQDGMISLSSHKLEIKDLPIAAMRSVRVKRNEPEQLLENNVEDWQTEIRSQMGQDPMRFVDRSHDMSTDSTRDDEAESFALCACKNGKIFVVGPDDECQASPVFCNEPTVNSNSNE